MGCDDNIKGCRVLLLVEVIVEVFNKPFSETFLSSTSSSLFLLFHSITSVEECVQVEELVD